MQISREVIVIWDVLVFVFVPCLIGWHMPEIIAYVRLKSPIVRGKVNRAGDWIKDKFWRIHSKFRN